MAQVKHQDIWDQTVMERAKALSDIADVLRDIKLAEALLIVHMSEITDRNYGKPPSHKPGRAAILLRNTMNKCSGLYDYSDAWCNAGQKLLKEQRVGDTLGRVNDKFGGALKKLADGEGK